MQIPCAALHSGSSRLYCSPARSPERSRGTPGPLSQAWPGSARAHPTGRVAPGWRRVAPPFCATSPVRACHHEAGLGCCPRCGRAPGSSAGRPATRASRVRPSVRPSRTGPPRQARQVLRRPASLTPGAWLSRALLPRHPSGYAWCTHPRRPDAARVPHQQAGPGLRGRRTVVASRGGSRRRWSAGADGGRDARNARWAGPRWLAGGGSTSRRGTSNLFPVFGVVERFGGALPRPGRRRRRRVR